jgi:hypothetical protein
MIKGSSAVLAKCCNAYQVPFAGCIQIRITDVKMMDSVDLAIIPEEFLGR